MSVSAIPTFAVVGAVNHGKSSVVSTLAENDQVRISSMPGETVEIQRFSLRDLFVFFDTPGFQNAFDALEELRPAAEARDSLEVFRKFIERHQHEPEFDAECRLFRPITEGAGVIYVVDGSRPWMEIHGAEMEILRLTGAPRLAIINRTSTDDHVADWKRRLGLHFNAVREFNAHAANFADRVELLETLAGIEIAWKPKLSQAVNILKEEWAARLDDCAAIVAGLLHDALRYQQMEPPKSELPTERSIQAEKLKARFMQALVDREAKAHSEIISLFGHRLVKPGSTADPVLGSDLFSAETWRFFGLGRKQLLAAGAVAGAAAGASVDAVTAGHTLLAGALVGGTVGAASAWLVGKAQPELKVEMPGKLGRFHFSGSEFVVGPVRAVNFPWILLDRAMATLVYVVNRAHARRDEVLLDAAHLESVLVQNGIASKLWPDEVRSACEKCFAAIRRGKLNTEQRAELERLIRARIDLAAGKRIEPSEFRR